MPVVEYRCKITKKRGEKRKKNGKKNIKKKPVLAPFSGVPIFGVERG